MNAEFDSGRRGSAGAGSFRVEHMAFNGTRNFPKQDLVDYLESIGIALRTRPECVHEFRRDRVYAARCPRIARGLSRRRSGFWKTGLPAVLFEAEEIDKERGGGDRGMAAGPEGCRGPVAGQTVPDPAQGLAIRGKAAHRKKGGAGHLQTRCGQAVLPGLGTGRT